MAFTIADAPEFELDGTREDVHAYFREIREKAPIARTRIGHVLALRHRHLDLITRDVTRQIETETKMMQGITSGPIYDFIANGMLFANGDAHLRRRAPVSRTFAFKLMDAMRPKAAALAAELVSERIGRGPIDFVNEIAAQIPARIIADILGIPRADLPVFMQWIADTAEALGFIDLERRAKIEKSLVNFNAYVENLLMERRAHPREDFLSDYVRATATDGVLTEDEIRTQIVGLILAGSDTTRGSLCMILAHLLTRPDQWAAFRANPDALKRGAVDEGLRYDPVISGIPRIAFKPFEIDGYAIPPGTPVSVAVISAMRDPEAYSEPDRFDIFRTDHPKWHPIFGGGAHRCVGEALARAEMEETLAAIARLAPATALVGAFPRLAPGPIRQVGRMEVAFA
ncbi:MAG: cytochrome P450 [Hyphomicrobiales bacterium]|nr:cytochrome P450 [Hyphomicrobiales bacterium]